MLAGGEGKRLLPLTADRAKPAVPFGGSYRLIDFVLSNLVNADYLRLCVLTQYKSHSLDRHITTTWRMSPMLGNYITPVPAQQRLGPRWYTGSADAIFQSLNLVYDEKPKYIIVFGADHVYRMDASAMVQAHIDSGAGVTVAGIRVPKEQGSTPLSVEERVEQIVLEMLLDHTHEEIPYIADIECFAIKHENDPKRARIDVNIFVDTGAQERIIVGQQGRTLVKIRAAAVEALEPILNKRVLLFLWVKSRGGGQNPAVDG